MSRESITVLGSGTCVPSLTRSSCSFLIYGQHERILLDLGMGTIHQLLRNRVMIDDIDVILFSHFHPDHSAEFPSFLFSTKYPSPMRRKKTLTAIGGEGLNLFYERLNNAFDHNLTLPDNILHLHDLPAFGKSEDLLQNFTLEWTTVKHRPESRAYRLTSPNGFKIVFSGDTDYSEELVAIAEAADLFICEAAFPDGHKVEGHLTPSLAGDIAEKAEVKHLVLTHFYPACEGHNLVEQCRSRYKGKISLAEDFQRHEF